MSLDFVFKPEELNTIWMRQKYNFFYYFFALAKNSKKKNIVNKLEMFLNNQNNNLNRPIFRKKLELKQKNIEIIIKLMRFL